MKIVITLIDDPNFLEVKRYVEASGERYPSVQGHPDAVSLAGMMLDCITQSVGREQLVRAIRRAYEQKKATPIDELPFGETGGAAP